MSDDRLVADSLTDLTWNAVWKTSQNVTFNLNYPRSGSGTSVTYVRIIVEQVSDKNKTLLMKTLT